MTLERHTPTTCKTCGARRDGPHSAFRDWESARKPLEEAHAAAIAEKDAEIERLRKHANDLEDRCAYHRRQSEQHLKLYDASRESRGRDLERIDALRSHNAEMQGWIDEWKVEQAKWRAALQSSEGT